MATQSNPEVAQALSNQVMPGTWLEASDDIDGGGRTYRLHIAYGDQIRAKYSEFDHALFHDVDHGPPSTTPIADRLLALETMVRRIEEAKHQASVTTAASTDSETDTKAGKNATDAPERKGEE